MSSVEWGDVDSVGVYLTIQTGHNDPPHSLPECSPYLNGVLPLGEVDLALALALGGPGSLELGETTAELTGELGAEVQRNVLLVLVEQTQLGALVGVDDGENASDRLANVGAADEKETKVSGRSLKISMFSTKKVNCDGFWNFCDVGPGSLAYRCDLRCRILRLLKIFVVVVVVIAWFPHCMNSPKPPVARRRNPSGKSVLVWGCRYRCTHILWVLVEAPLAIFWTRSWLSSVFNSSSCLESSSLFFPQS